MDMNKQKRSFNGVVTKFIDNFGFIDDDVFFRIEVVEDGSVKINDQVYVECEYSEQLPFKWNATKVKLLNPRGAPTYLQHRMQQMLQQHSLQQTTNNLNAVVAQQQQQLSQKTAQDAANFFTPELRKIIEKQQQQPPIQNYQQNIQNNQQFNRQNDFNQSPAFSGQITYTSTPGAAFVSPVLPFNQPINVPQQTLPLSNLRAFSNNQQNNYPKRDGLHNRKDRDDHKNLRDNRGGGNRGKDNRDDHRDRQRDNDRTNRDDKRADSIRDRDNSRDNNRDLRERKNATTPATRDRRNTESPSGSITSSSNTSKPRRRYTPLHIPLHEILKSPINSFDIKRKFDSSIHIPSDFKELQINNTFELNFQSLHKPIQYRIVHPSNEKEQKTDESDKKESSKKDEDSKDSKNNKDSKAKKLDESTSESKKDLDNSKDESNDKSTSKSSEKNEEATKNEEKSDLNKSYSSNKKKLLPLSNKYAVKVLLLSIPSMNNIYDRVIESDRDKEGYSSNNKAYFLHFNKIFSYLCLKNHNDGHSLIGGKFDPKLDGFISENKPNLIQTAIRCVKQQTGIDLSPCKKWKHMCTFLYNRDDSPFYEDVPFEYSNIFIPDVWSLLENPSCIKTEENSDNKIVDNKLLDTLTSCSSKKNSIKEEEKDQSTLDDTSSLVGSSKIDFSNGGDSFNSLQVHPSDSILNDLSSINNSKVDESSTIDPSESVIDQSINDNSVEIDISQLNELKVTELRARLEELGHKTAKNVKKADLVTKLSNILKSQKTKEEVSKLDQTDEESNLEAKEEEPNKVEEIMETSDNQIKVKEEEEINHVAESKETSTEQSSIKRKAEDESLSAEQNSKKVKQDPDEKIDDKESKEIINKPVSDDGFIMAYGSNSITVLNLYQALNHNKYDHFELQIVSELLKEALISHFGNFILSACYENRHLLKEQQDDPKKDEPFTQKDIIENNNYVLLAFSYFDSCHCGYVLADDLLKLLSCCGINFSKRTWTNIFGSNNEKIKYGNFKEPSKIYNFNLIEQKVNKQQNSSNEVKSSLYIKDGNVFDIDKLISQSESDEKLKVELKDKLRLAEENIKNLQTNLTESNNKQSKMASAFKKQNDEICDYKRDKEKIKQKYEESLKLINSTLGHFNDFIKKHEDKISEK